MGKCTAAQAITEAQYWLRYCEKASADYAASDSKSVFNANTGSGNYTYFGSLWGLQGQAWCAMFVTTCIYRACGSDKSIAKTVLHGLLPYSACDQLYDAAPAAYKGRSKYYGGTWTPQAGDVIVFTQNGQRVHMGFVESATSTTISTIEGNIGDKVNRKSYAISSSYIWGYVRPLYADAVSGGTAAGKTAKASVTLPYVGTGYTADAAYVKTAQVLLNGKGAKLDVDGECGDLTVAAIKKYAASDGILGPSDWTKLLS